MRHIHLIDTGSAATANNDSPTRSIDRRLIRPAGTEPINTSHRSYKDQAHRPDANHQPPNPTANKKNPPQAYPTHQTKTINTPVTGSNLAITNAPVDESVAVTYTVPSTGSTATRGLALIDTPEPPSNSKLLHTRRRVLHHRRTPTIEARRDIDRTRPTRINSKPAHTTASRYASADQAQSATQTPHPH